MLHAKNYFQDHRVKMKKDIDTKVSFWATKCGYTWNDKKAKILHNKLILLEDNIEKIRGWLIDNYSDIKKHDIGRRK